MNWMNSHASFLYFEVAPMVNSKQPVPREGNLFSLFQRRGEPDDLP